MPIPEFIVELRRNWSASTVLWLPGVTAVVRRREALAAGPARRQPRADAAVTGIVDPGEEPAVAARREALEEAGVEIRVDRLAQVGVVGPITYPNGDRTTYLDHVFACIWLSGQPYVADDESVAVGWHSLDSLPPISPEISARVEAALVDEERTRFVR